MCPRACDQLIDRNGPLPTSLRSNKGQSGVVQWQCTRVPITLTPTCTQPPGSRPRKLGLHPRPTGGPFSGGGSYPSAEDTVGIFYALPTAMAVDCDDDYD